MKIFAAFLLSSVAYAEPTILPVSQDASLIKSSYSAPNTADAFFGSEAEIKVGSYHLQSEGLLRFELTSIQHLLYSKAELVIVSPRVVGSSPAEFSLAQVSPDWLEESVSWNSRPETIQELGLVTVGTGELRVDVTKALNHARYYGHTALALGLAAEGPSNLFFPSREGSEGAPSSYLLITPFEEPVESL